MKNTNLTYKNFLLNKNGAQSLSVWCVSVVPGLMACRLRCCYDNKPMQLYLENTLTHKEVWEGNKFLQQCLQRLGIRLQRLIQK